MKSETLVILAFVVLVGAGAIWITGLAGIGGILVLLGLGLWSWFLLGALPELVFLPLLIVLPKPAARLFFLLFLLGLACIVVGLLLISLDPRTHRDTLDLKQSGLSLS